MEAKVPIIQKNIALIGDGGCGKSAFLSLFPTRKFHKYPFPHQQTDSGVIHQYLYNMEDYESDYDLALNIRCCQVMNQLIQFESDKDIGEAVDAFLLMFDLSNRRSFEMVKTCVNEIKNNRTLSEKPIVIMANKCDKDWILDREEILESFQGYDIAFMSAQIRLNITETFKKLTSKFPRLTLA